MRTGIGYDIHRLTPTPNPVCEKPGIMLGGIHLPCPFLVEAHSDGDVLLHAIVDACLGAMALGDIGTWFPDNRPENRRRPSRDFVVTVRDHIGEMGWQVVQMDTIVMLEKPKVMGHAPAIRENLATLFEIERENIGLKAKTMEGLGPIGASQAVAAQAIVVMNRKSGKFS